jgi:SAM-dependent methyltransferase
VTSRRKSYLARQQNVSKNASKQRRKVNHNSKQVTVTIAQAQNQDLEKARVEKQIIDGVACPACKKEQSRILRVGIREDSGYPVYLCRSCRLQFIQPRHTDLRAYYRDQYRNSHNDNLGLGAAESPEDRFLSQQSGSLIAASAFREFVEPGASVLEIGCSAGGFLSHIYEDYDCYGLEWNPDDAAYVRDVGELPCEETTLEECYPGKQFTAIVARAVFEHMPDPVAFLESIRDRLIGGGYLYMEMPNANTALAAVYACKPFQDWWFNEAHITYWEPEVLAQLLTVTGFEARIRPVQRYGMLNAINWLLKGEPMPREQGLNAWKPVDKRHPAATPLNRICSKLDKEYRIQMETLGMADQIKVMARRREI